MICDYAACSRTAVKFEDGWKFCAPHLEHHRAIMQGRPLPDLPRHLLPKDRNDIAPCGTEGGARRHGRAGEKPCRPCLDAAAFAARRRNARRQRMSA